MSATEALKKAADKLNVNLNQNLWVLIASFAALGCSEYFGLCSLYRFANFICYFVVGSMCVCLVAYTWRYLINKISPPDKSDSPQK